MAQRVNFVMGARVKQFPPEADGVFPPVSDDEIAASREKLREQYGIGEGKMTVVDDPFAR